MHKALALTQFHTDRLLFSALASPSEQLVSMVVAQLFTCLFYDFFRGTTLSTQHLIQSNRRTDG